MHLPICINSGKVFGLQRGGLLFKLHLPICFGWIADSAKFNSEPLPEESCGAPQRRSRSSEGVTGSCRGAEKVEQQEDFSSPYLEDLDSPL